MLNAIKRKLWGDLTAAEFKRYGMLSAIFFFTIGTYWLLRPLKDGLFFHIVGAAYWPWAKIGSVLVMVPLVLLYSKLVDLVTKQKLFYVLCSLYAASFLIISFLLKHPTIGLANDVASPDRYLGWAVYLLIESFGSLLPPLFWTFVVSSSKESDGKKGFGLIISGAQVGSILGPYLATQATSLGSTLLIALGAGGILCIPLLVKLFIIQYPKAGESDPVKNEKGKKKTGMLEGLRLIVSRPYLIGVLGVTTLYEVVATILDYQMKVLGHAQSGKGEAFTVFLGYFGMSVNTLSLVFALLGTSFLMRKFGLVFCLVAFPLSVAGIVAITFSFPRWYVFFFAVVAIKGISYALNNPCKEMMWLTTSKDAKFKAKGWIDMIGGRTAKGTGASIASFFSHNMSQLLIFGSLASFGIIGLWIVAAIYVGTTNRRLIETKQIIS